MQAKPITTRVHVSRHRQAPGLSIAQLHREQLPEHLDPFLAFDHFEMAQPFFPPHPHAGFSAVTYMFPQSKGGFVNRDSRGEQIDIHPGDLHWTAAGRGIMHEEVPITRGVACDGLQIFVDLPADKKWMAPEVHHLDSAAVPRVTTPTSDVRVVLGRHGDSSSPVPAPTAVTLLDVVLQPGGALEHSVPAGESRFLYVIEGEVAVDGAQLRQGDAVGFGAGDTVVVLASDKPGHFVVGGGAPLRQPVFFHGPFCMTSREDLTRAIRAYQSGAMGHLEPSF